MANTSSPSVVALSRPPLPPKDKASRVRKLPAACETDEKEKQLVVLKGRDKDLNMDPKRLKRVMASRQYSQKYRMKQQTYIGQLETEMKALHAEVAVNGPRINYVGRQNNLLRTENGSMKQKLAALTNELMYKESQYIELKRERDYLKQLYMENSQMMMMADHQPFQTANTYGNYPFMNINPNNSGFDS